MTNGELVYAVFTAKHESTCQQVLTPIRDELTRMVVATCASPAGGEVEELDQREDQRVAALPGGMLAPKASDLRRADRNSPPKKMKKLKTDRTEAAVRPVTAWSTYFPSHGRSRRDLATTKEIVVASEWGVTYESRKPDAGQQDRG